MAKGMYHYIGEAWKKPDIKLLRARMIEWRKSESVVEVDKPLRLDRARSLGYKAKKGYFVARVRIIRGGKQRPRPKKRRKVGNLTVKKILKMSYQTVAEQRAQKKYHNLEVLNSYNIGKDGIYAYYEVIMVDPQRPEIKNDSTINWICSNKNKKRVYRGLTGSSKRTRG